MLMRASIAVVALVFSLAFANAQNPTDEDFVAKAASSLRFEVLSTKIALSASSGGVKEFAREMLTEQRALNKALKAAAAAAKLPIPKAMNQEDRAVLESLKGKSGEAFDRLYLEVQLKKYDDAVALFSTYSQFGTNPKLKDYALATLSTLKKRQEQVKSKLGSGKSS